MMDKLELKKFVAFRKSIEKMLEHHQVLVSEMKDTVEFTDDKDYQQSFGHHSGVVSTCDYILDCLKMLGIPEELPK